MAVTQVSTGDSEEWMNASGARALTKDTGSASGDFAIVGDATFEVGSNTMTLANFTTPGEISFPGTNTGQIFHRALDGSEGATYSISASAAVFGTAALMTMRGNGALTFASATLGTGASGTTCTAPSVSGTAGQVLVVVMFTSDPTTMTTPSGMTAGTVGLQNTGTLRMFWEVLSATGATGTRASTLGTSRDNIAYSILLNDAGGGGGGAVQPPRSMHQYRLRRAA